MNTNPALFTNTRVLLEVIPGVVEEALDIVMGDYGITAPPELNHWVKLGHEYSCCFSLPHRKCEHNQEHVTIIS
jgi:hypothetical protein